MDPRWKNPQGKSVEALWRWAQDLIVELRKSAYLGGLQDSIDGLNSAIDEKADKDQVTFGSWLIPAPEDKDYPVIVNCPVAFTITDVTTRTSAGTATVTVKINSTALGGSPNSASTSESTESHSSDNEVGVGDSITITVGDTNDAEDLTVTIAGTRELATS